MAKTKALDDYQRGVMAAWEAAATSVRQRTIEECEKLITRERQYFDGTGKHAADRILYLLSGLKDRP